MADPQQPTMAKILLPMRDAARNRELVSRILEALWAYPATRACLEAPGIPMPAVGFITVAELSGGPPPAGVPLFNEDIGVLSVPAPAHAPVDAVLSALGELAASVDVEPEETMRTQ